MLEAWILWGTITIRVSGETERKTAGVIREENRRHSSEVFAADCYPRAFGPRGGKMERISGAVDWAAGESFAIRINARQLCPVRLAHRVSAWVCTQSPEGWVGRYDLDRAGFCDGCHRGLVMPPGRYWTVLRAEPRARILESIPTARPSSS